MRKGWLRGGALDLLNGELIEFVAVAEHARVIGSRNPCGLFRWLIARWDKTERLRGKDVAIRALVTHSDENSALTRLRQHFEPERYGPRKKQPQPKPRDLFKELSDDAQLAKAAQRVLRQKGFKGHPFIYVRRQLPDWTRERWDAAIAELEAARIGQARENARVETTLGAVKDTSFADIAAKREAFQEKWAAAVSAREQRAAATPMTEATNSFAVAFQSSNSM